jgi:membrane-associated phospholipid phosphatase
MIRVKMKIIKALSLIAILTFTNAIPAHSDDYLMTVGDIGQYALPVAAFGIAALQKDWKGCFQFCASYAASMCVAYGLKYTVKSTRPDGGSESFPSGHTTSAFAGAAFLDIRYGAIYGVPAYIAASVVGWSRIESNRHYPEDVVVGAAIGVLGDLVFARRFQKKISIVPIAANGAYGAVIRCRF